MTMLDRMRRHKAWLKWSLGVVVATFILLYVPQFLRTNNVGANDVIATVDNRKVSAAAYQQLYNQQVAQIRASTGEASDQLIRQFGIADRVVQSLVAREAVLREAERLGITVSDGELRERLISSPMFQDNGQFIGEARYRQMLQSARPPLTPGEFEQQFRDQLISEKLQAAVTGWVHVSDADVEREYKARNEKAKLDVAVFTADKFKSTVQATDAEISTQFSDHQETYRIPEKRRVRYISINAEALRTKMAVTPQEVETRYQTNIQTYSTPEQVRASHILLKTEGKDDAAVKKAAEAVLAKVKAGGNFAALAKQYSEDEASKATGGDLDYFGKGSMVPAFEDAAWAMKPGDTSGLVKSEYGYHIIRVTDHRAATTKSLSEVRAQLEDSIRYEKAQAAATQTANEIANELKAPADLDRIAQKHGLTVSDSGLFAREEPISGLGFAPSVSATAFTQDTGKVSPMTPTPRGYAFFVVSEIKPTYLPKLDEVKDKVKDDVVRVKAVEIAESKAGAVAKATGANFASAARAAGVEVKTTDLIARGASLPDIGVNERVQNVAFALKTNEVSAPIPTDNAVVVIRMRERQDASEAGLTADREKLRTELTSTRAAEFFDAYMTKAKAKMKIEMNENTLRALTAS